MTVCGLVLGSFEGVLVLEGRQWHRSPVKLSVISSWKVSRRISIASSSGLWALCSHLLNQPLL